MTAIDFMNRRENHPEFCIPIALLPATINNNVPGSDFSIGADTAVNIIVKVSSCWLLCFLLCAYNSIKCMLCF